MTLVLASQSASRRAMLEAAGVAFAVCPARIDERALESDLAGAGAGAGEIVLALAKAKAAAVAGLRPGDRVLGSDSMVEVEGRRFGKPASRDEAEEHLRFFSGRTMHLHSAAALIGGGTEWAHGESAELRLRSLSPAFIAGYLAREWPMVGACAGVFRIEGAGVNLFEHIKGSHFTVLGMPLLAVLGALRACGEIPA